MPEVIEISETPEASEASDISDTDSAILAYLIEEGECPRFNYVHLLSKEAVNILDNALEPVLNHWLDDALQLKIKDQSFEIPTILTSRGTLEFLGFNHSRVEELWNFLKEEDNRAPTLAPIDEFKERMLEYVNEIIKSMHLRNEGGQFKSSAELLDILGLTNDTQSHPVRLIPAPGLGGVKRTLRETPPGYVLTLAEDYIRCRFKFLQEMDSLVVTQQEGWWEEIVEGFTQLPIIVSNEAYTAVLVSHH